jgi:hypothetical protein
MTKETYVITMWRTYCTTFEVEANSKEEAGKIFDSMAIEDICIEELKQCNITETNVEI